MAEPHPDSAVAEPHPDFVAAVRAAYASVEAPLPAWEALAPETQRAFVEVFYQGGVRSIEQVSARPLDELAGALRLSHRFLHMPGVIDHPHPIARETAGQMAEMIERVFRKYNLPLDSGLGAENDGGLHG